MRLLALDMSVNVGWVLFDRPGELKARGTESLEGSRDHGERFNAFFIWLLAKIEVQQPDVLAWEEPIRPRFGSRMNTTMQTVKLLQGLAAIAELTAVRCGVLRRIGVPTATAKKKLAGHGHADKHMMIGAAVRMGIIVADEHQADALAVALCAYEHCGIDVKGYAGPLLADQARW
jgi:Holliday junction resolvasome RuvABC endonuclease subunit